MKVFVTSRTGPLSQATITALLEAGHEVTVLVHDDACSAWLLAQGVQPTRGSGLNHALLCQKLRGHDVLVNLTSLMADPKMYARWRGRKNFLRSFTETSAGILAAALEARVPRVIHESATTIYRDKGAEWIDESAPIDQYPAAMAYDAGEARVRRFSNSGGIGIVLRFGEPYGSGAEESERAFDFIRRFGIATINGQAHGFVSPIEVHDGARAVVAALTAPPGTYNVVDDEPMTKTAYANAVAKAAGRKLRLTVPGRLALSIGSHAVSQTHSLRISNTRLKTLTDWAPRYPNARDGWLAIAAARARGW